MALKNNKRAYDEFKNTQNTENVCPKFEKSH
jgi:hypothetical protein